MNIRYFEKRPGAWHLDFRRLDGTRCRPYGGATEKEARANTQRLIAMAEGPREATLPTSGPTLRASFEVALKVREKWLQAKDKGSLETTYRGLGLPDAFPLAGLSRDKVRELRAKWMAEPGKRQGTKLAPSTINHRLSMLSVLLEVQDMAPHNVKHLSTKGNARHRRISDAEFTQMRNWAIDSRLKDSSEFYRLMVAGLETGARLGELLTVLPADVRENSVTFRSTKNHLSRTVPLTPAAKAALSTAGGLLGPFPALTVDRVTALWSAMRASMGLAEDHNFVFHLLRHECASRLADRGLGAHTIMAMLGHESIKTSEGYVKMSLGGLARAIGVDMGEAA